MTDTLVDYASGRQMLLVLDTCDAQPGASAELIARLLTGGTGLRVLATSREPFGLPGEVVWRIPPLSVEPAPAGGPSDAMALLLDRTAAARGGRRGGLGRVGRAGTGRRPPRRAAAGDRAGRRPAAGAQREPARRAPRRRARHARRRPRRAGRRREHAGGLAGGQEDTVDIAAAAGGAIRSPQLRAAIRSATQRHATMQATVTWSYRTLGPRAARLLRWLSVFSGPVDLGTVEWLLDDDPLDPLAVLVDKSMIQVEPHGAGSTYRMLDPIRAYAARRLVDAGEEQTARDRHVAWCAARPPAGVPRCRRPAGHAVAVRARPAGRRGARGAALDRDRGQRPDGAAALPAGSTSGGASAAWPGRAGSGCSGSTGGSPRRASRSPTRSWRRPTTCTLSTPAPTASSPRSCGSRSGPRRPPGRPATPGCWPGSCPAARRR